MEGLKFSVGGAKLKSDSSLSITLDFDNVIGAPAAVDAINLAAETIHCPTAFNALQLGLAGSQLLAATYGAIKSAKDNH